MKTKSILLTSVVFFCLLMVSCTKGSFEIAEYQANEISLVLDNDQAINISDNSVSISDVLCVAEKEFPNSKGTNNASKQFEIAPYVKNSSDTLMYIVNYKNNKGWKIYSSDKRTPAILAEGDAGYFSLEEGSPAVEDWISCVADDIARVKKSSDSELNFSENDIKLNKAFWSGESPRIIVDSIPHPLIIGHWEETISSQSIEYDHLDHLVAHWDQEDPYNECCPFYVSPIGVRSSAGCVAIAGAQLLLYLHYKIGLPESMVSEGYCMGNVNNYDQIFSNPSSTVWSSMSTEYIPDSFIKLPEAIMIGYVGQTVNMHYRDNILGQYSWALPGNLKSNLFEDMGISCSRGSYDEDIVRSSLLNQMPVIVSASQNLIPVNGNIHCFVIDGYQRTQTKYTHYYHFVVEQAPSTPYLVPEDYVAYTYSSPYLSRIKINWGWSSQWNEYYPVNDGWYTLTGSWTVTNGDTYSYDNYRNMTYGFTAAEQN